VIHLSVVVRDCNGRGHVVGRRGAAGPGNQGRGDVEGVDYGSLLSQRSRGERNCLRGLAVALFLGTRWGPGQAPAQLGNSEPATEVVPSQN
jgi:hypothetical protein